MKYRSKLYIAFVSIATVSTVLALVIFSTETEKLIFRIFRARSVSIAATAATGLDPELFKQAIKAKSIKDPGYIKAQKSLQKILYANRRSDIYVSDIYVLYPNPKDPTELLYGVKADPTPVIPGTVYNDSDRELILKNKNTYFSNPTFISDQLGIWLSGFAPIRDKEGNYIATLSIDLNAADIHAQIIKLINYALYGFIASLFLALIIAYILSKKVTKSLDHLCNVVKEIGDGRLDTKAHIDTHDEFGELSSSINAMGSGLKERDRLKMSFARYVSSHILERILKVDSPLKLEGESRKVTVLFSDIRGFTNIAEKLQPEEVVQLLNEYFEVMIEVIFTHNGTLDKFIGDGLMAEFGAPLADEKQEEHATRAALEMQKALVKLSDKWESEGRPRLQMGIGIHTGDAVVGNIGSEKRTEYTAIGDTVNVASRLEQATKIIKVPILLSESTYLGAQDQFSFKDLGTMALPGRKEQIRVYTINEDSK